MGATSCQLCPAGFQPSGVAVGNGTTVNWTPASLPTLQTGCLACATLSYKAKGDNACSKCPPGSQTEYPFPGATSCTLCPPGSVNPSQTAAISNLAPGAGAGSYFASAPDGELGSSDTCLPW